MTGPSRINIGIIMIQGRQVVVEAQGNGWISLTSLGPWPLDGADAPTRRIHASADEAMRWVHEVRRRLASDTVAFRQLRPLGGEIIGARVTVPKTTERASETSVSFIDCGGGQASMRPPRDSLVRLVAIIEEAAQVSQRGEPQLDLRRPLYAHEVSCPAAPRDDNPLPAFPDEVAPSEQWPTEVGVQFVVDTVGRVERGTITIMPGTPDLFTREAVRVLERWRFKPAHFSTRKVRQVVQMTVLFDPRPIVPENGRQLTIIGEPDGWVRVRETWRRDAFTPGFPTLRQEWFTPDSIDAFLARQRERLRAMGSERPRSGGFAPQLIMRTGDTTQTFRLLGTKPPEAFLDNEAPHALCRAYWFEGEGAPDERRLDLFGAAVYDAREHRAEPERPGSRVHAATDVTCRASLPWVRMLPLERRGMRKVPVLPYPASMARRNARAEIFASFVVDTAGAVEPRSVEIMPGGDPDAVIMLHEYLPSLPFTPATRGGLRVRQRVFRSFVFAPDPECPSPRSPYCPLQ